MNGFIALADRALCLIGAMTQDDVFKSISQNVSGEGDGGGHEKTFLAVLLGTIGIILLLALFNVRNKRQAMPKAVNHPGRLMKEVMRQIPLKPAELKQLKVLAEGERRAGVEIDSPLVFLICPSALATALRANRAKIDKKVMTGIARKMGLVGAGGAGKKQVTR